MKRILLLPLALTLCFSSLAAPPTEASIEELLSVTKADSLMDTMLSQLEQSIRAGMVGATQGKQLTPEQQKVIEVAPGKLAAALRQELNWANLKPIYVQIYREVLDQSEIDGIIAFYGTPAGQAMIAKMPTIMQKSMAVTQERLKGLLPRVEAAMKDALAEAGVRQ